MNNRTSLSTSNHTFLRLRVLTGAGLASIVVIAGLLLMLKDNTPVADSRVKVTLYSSEKQRGPSIAQGEINSLQQAINTLAAQKNLNPDAQQQLDILQEQLGLYTEMEDHELRLALHKSEAGFDTISYQRKIADLRKEAVTLGRTSNSTH